jgi:fucose permease
LSLTSIQLETYYKLSYSVVSIVFLAPFFGYCVAAFSNNLIRLRLGQRGVAIMGPFLHLLAFSTLSVHPPYPVFVVFLVGAGFGTGCLDAAWCAWTGNMASANKVQGFLHACYSLGATLGPLIATSIIAPNKGRHPWYEFFYITVCLRLGGKTSTLDD